MSTATEEPTTVINPKRVRDLYRRLERNRAKITTAEAQWEQYRSDRSDLWVELMALGETQKAVADASGVHKSFVMRDLERRAARG